MKILKDSTNVSIYIRLLTTAGLPFEGAVAADVAFWYWRGASKGAITPVDLATLGDAWAEGGFLHIDDGYYRLDVPDAAFEAGAGSVLIGGSVAGGLVVATEIVIDDGTLAAVKAKTDLIGTGTAIVFQPMTADGDEITIVRYDSYTTDMNRSMTWDFPSAEFGDWTGKEVSWKAAGTRPNNVVGPIALTVSGEGTADQAATLELSSDDTDAEPGRYDWAVVVTDPSDPDFRLTARVGCMDIQDTPYPPAT